MKELLRIPVVGLFTFASIVAHPMIKGFTAHTNVLAPMLRTAPVLVRCVIWAG